MPGTPILIYNIKKPIGRAGQVLPICKNEVIQMALDAATLALTAAELKTTLADAKIAKLFEPTRDELVITLRTRTETDSLLLSARSGSARVCLTEESFENPETPPSFCMLMRKHLTGGRLLTSGWSRATGSSTSSSSVPTRWATLCATSSAPS